MRLTIGLCRIIATGQARHTEQRKPRHDADENSAEGAAECTGQTCCHWVCTVSVADGGSTTAIKKGSGSGYLPDSPAPSTKHTVLGSAPSTPRVR